MINDYIYVLMPHWPLSLRPMPSCRTVHHRKVAITPSIAVHHNCARSQSPSLSRHSLLSIAVESPLRRPSPSRSLCAVHCHRAVPSIIVEETSITIHSHASPSSAVNPSIAVESPSCRPSPSTAHRCWDAIAPSIAVLAIEPSVAVELPMHHPPSITVQRPSASRSVNCCCAVNCCQAIHPTLNCCLLTMWYNCVSMMYSTLLYSIAYLEGGRPVDQ